MHCKKIWIGDKFCCVSVIYGRVLGFSVISQIGFKTLLYCSVDVVSYTSKFLFIYSIGELYETTGRFVGNLLVTDYGVLRTGCN